MRGRELSPTIVPMRWPQISPSRASTLIFRLTTSYRQSNSVTIRNGLRSFAATSIAPSPMRFWNPIGRFSEPEPETLGPILLICSRQGSASRGRRTAPMFAFRVSSPRNSAGRLSLTWIRSMSLRWRQKRKMPSTSSRTFPALFDISIPSLLAFIPNGSWCPLVVQPKMWATARPPFASSRPPTVVHAPGGSRLKGSKLEFDPVLEDLDRRGLINYRCVTQVAPLDMPEVYAQADIVVDQVGIGVYGVAACEALAAGRIVLSDIPAEVRDYIHRRTGLELPILDVTPESIAESVTKILDDPESAGRTAAPGAGLRTPGPRRSVLGGKSCRLLDRSSRARGEETPKARRGRIVMLVDNNVTRDSRVQKQARSAAARGWHVTLLGRRQGKERTKWRLGGANVQLVEVSRQTEPTATYVARRASQIAVGLPPIGSGAIPRTAGQGTKSRLRHSSGGGQSRQRREKEEAHQEGRSRIASPTAGVGGHPTMGKPQSSQDS